MKQNSGREGKFTDFLAAIGLFTILAAIALAIGLCAEKFDKYNRYVARQEAQQVLETYKTNVIKETKKLIDDKFPQ